jgi:transposase
VEQQDIQSLHRVRSRLVKNRTALINEIRGLNLEYGITIPQGALKVKNYLRLIIDNEENELTALSRELMQELYDELIENIERLKKLEKKIKLICNENDQCRRILSIPDIGELTATAIVAAVPNANEFKSGRHMSAWLGLVPRQSSSGNKQVLLGISKRGDRYLRTLLIHGARSALCHCKETDSKHSHWISHKKTSLSFNKAAVALANKNARIIWSLLKTGMGGCLILNIKGLNLIKRRYITRLL